MWATSANEILLMYMYVYMYCSRIWHLTVLVKSHKIQLEAMHSSKQSDFERDFEGNTKVLSNTTTLARAAIPSAKLLRSTPVR